MTPKSSSEKTVREIKRRTRRKYSAEEKIRIIMDGLRGEDSIAEICRREGIHQNMYYKWSRTFLEAGKKRLMGDTMREAGTDEVKEIRQENMHLKQLVADLALKHSVLKKRSHGLNIDWKE
jgi:transposase